MNNIFKEAEKIVNGDRYGKPENNFNVIAELWSGYLGFDIEAEDVANMMILLKVARNASGHGKTDNYIDICGYAHFGQLFANGEDAEEDESERMPMFKNTVGAREMMNDRKKHNVTHCQTCLHKEVRAGEPCNACAVINFGQRSYYSSTKFEKEMGTR